VAGVDCFSFVNQNWSSAHFKRSDSFGHQAESDRLGGNVDFYPLLYPTADQMIYPDFFARLRSVECSPLGVLRNPLLRDWTS